MEITNNILIQEKLQSNTAITGHEDFDRQGALVIQDMIDVTPYLEESPPKDRGIFFFGKTEYEFSHQPDEKQVEGSLSRYNHPKYKELSYTIKNIVESIINCELFPTYYYDRFYFDGQQLTPHVDRPACEISVSLHLQSNPSDVSWPIGIKTPQQTHEKAFLSLGDGLLYKGCERPHWREKIVRPKKRFFNKKENFWYHQIFFHYVLADGLRVEFAGDKI
jgi:hypothetical protein